VEKVSKNGNGRAEGGETAKGIRSAKKAFFPRPQLCGLKAALSEKGEEKKKKLGK